MSENSIDHIKFRRIRPRVRFESELNSEQFLEVIKERLSITSDKFEGQILPGYATFYPLQKDQHFWSPQLTLSIEETESGSLIRGLYGPKPSVWTMFMFFYSFIGFITMIAIMISLSYWSLGHESLIFWSVPALILLFLSLYLVAYIGQKFGHKQMVYLHKFLEECFGERIETI
tara:strand:+ start:26567 stop:27088 length:522 start_codon:yes stop_codon:yes gene_type:complete